MHQIISLRTIVILQRHSNVSMELGIWQNIVSKGSFGNQKITYWRKFFQYKIFYIKI